MSIINNALKKAQRQRSAGTTPVAAGAGGASGSRGSNSMSGQNLVLLLAGVAAIIVVSVVITVYLVRSSPEPISPANLAGPVAPSAEMPADSSPLVVMPEITHAEPVTDNAAANSTASAAEPVKAAVIEPKVVPIPVAVVPDTSHVTPDDRIYAYIEKLQVVGIRSSGADSKVLMNNRVFRVNDMVDRDLMLRLVKVSPDSLTFLDANGIIYTKYF